MNRQTLEMIDSLRGLGISLDDAMALRRASMTLHRWYEMECGDSNDRCSFGIERDENTGIPYMVTYPHNSNTPLKRRIADREAGAKRRISEILATYGLEAKINTDPRGCALTVHRHGESNGVAVYK